LSNKLEFFLSWETVLSYLDTYRNNKILIIEGGKWGLTVDIMRFVSLKNHEKGWKGKIAKQKDLRYT